MKVETKILIIVFFNLSFIYGIGLATSFNTKWWIVLSAFYLCGTLLGAFFGYYQCIRMNRDKFILPQQEVSK